jgi:phage baseplate assembly protein W
MTDVAYPFAIDPRGRTALAQSDDHLRQMTEQVLFTALGERVTGRPSAAGSRSCCSRRTTRRSRRPST